MPIKLTPGPWILREQGDANQYAITTPDNHWVLGLIHNGESLQAQQLANLRLIVEAPAMLEALRALADPTRAREGRMQQQAILARLGGI